ncbi:hypothetical protein ACFVT2_42730 [Streptomyces sp. NPDC058000]|uniref:hypothetical protein n=1 Tax=Streptomyces sp. NPDC058000 TaxID=3346299 RepID=UPI0036E6D91A
MLEDRKVPCGILQGAHLQAVPPLPVGEGGASGATEERHTAKRATLNPVLARNPNVKVSATVASNHSAIVRKDFRAVAAAVREIGGTRAIGERRTI